MNVNVKYYLFDEHGRKELRAEYIFLTGSEEEMVIQAREELSHFHKVPKEQIKVMSFTEE